jgi:acyl-CoA synthetase (AMP-forming)/AMP-acid ligase II
METVVSFVGLSSVSATNAASSRLLLSLRSVAWDAISAENSYNWITVFLAAVQSDGVFCPIDKELPDDDLAYVINHGDDEIIFCDTGKEFPAMYEHIREVERYTGRKITTLKSPKSFDYYFCEHIKTKGKNQGHKGYGWATMRIRWCTSRLKIDVTRKYLSRLKEPYTLYLGIAYDEPKRHENKADNMEHPLYDWKITEKEALSYCYERGFTWGVHTKYLVEFPVGAVPCNLLMN